MFKKRKVLWKSSNRLPTTSRTSPKSAAPGSVMADLSASTVATLPQSVMAEPSSETSQVRGGRRPPSQPHHHFGGVSFNLDVYSQISQPRNPRLKGCQAGVHSLPRVARRPPLRSFFHTQPFMAMLLCMAVFFSGLQILAKPVHWRTLWNTHTQ